MEEKDYIESGKHLSGEQTGTPAPDGLESIRQIWDMAGTYRYESENETDLAWEKISRQIAAPAPLKVSWVRRHSRSIAAAVALFAVAGTATWFLTREPSKETIAAIHEKTGNREIKTINLSDGSSIVLNSNSEITVAENFNSDNRNIILQGEARFEVAHNEKMPFIVTAGNTRTQVIGTGFNISAFKGEQVKIVVSHGKVKFGHENNTLFLTKGQAAAYNQEGDKLSRTADTASFAWQNDVWVFQSTTLDEVSSQIRHRFGKPLKYDAKNGSRLFTGKFPAGTSADQIAKTISLALQINVTTE